MLSSSCSTKRRPSCFTAKDPQRHHPQRLCWQVAPSPDYQAGCGEVKSGRHSYLCGQWAVPAKPAGGKWGSPCWSQAWTPPSPAPLALRPLPRRLPSARPLSVILILQAGVWAATEAVPSQASSHRRQRRGMAALSCKGQEVSLRSVHRGLPSGWLSPESICQAPLGHLGGQLS